MSRAPRLSIESAAALTGVGWTARQTCAAIRAGVSGYESRALLPPPSGAVTVVRVADDRAARHPAGDWLLSMAAHALRQCCAGLTYPTRRIATLLAFAEPARWPRDWGGVEAIEIMGRLHRRVDRAFHPSSRPIQGGHAAVLSALEYAHELLLSGGIDCCIVGGVDSLLDRQTLSTLRDSGRLHGLTPQGLVPGEGACFVALGRAENAWAATGASVAGFAHARERATVWSDDYSQGDGLRSALAGAVSRAGCQESEVAFRVSDMNGERYRAWESSVCAMRFYRTRRERLPSMLPATCTGDLGAASGALSLIVAADAIARGYAPGPIGVCEASSDDGLRAAAVLAAPGP